MTKKGTIVKHENKFYVKYKTEQAGDNFWQTIKPLDISEILRLPKSFEGDEIEFTILQDDFVRIIKSTT